MSNLEVRTINTPEDIKMFNSFNDTDLVALIVFRKDESKLWTPMEADQSLRWLEMALDGRWPSEITPRHFSGNQADVFEFRKQKIRDILQDPGYGSVINCDEHFYNNHIVFEFENVITGKPYYCEAIFKN